MALAGRPALGVALATGEIEHAPKPPSAGLVALFQRRGTSAGVELLRNEIVVLGNATGWGGVW